MAEFVKLTVQDYIATVVMDRPPVNAQNSEFRQELITTFDSLTDRDDVRVAILTGDLARDLQGLLNQRGPRESLVDEADAGGL